MGNCTSNHDADASDGVGATGSKMLAQFDAAGDMAEKTEGNGPVDVSAGAAVSRTSSIRIATTLSTLQSSDSFVHGDEVNGLEVTPKSQPHVSKLFSTPTDQPTINYNDLGMSGKILLAKAEERIESDGILDEIQGELTFERKRCILFIYANNFFWQKSIPERVNGVKSCVEDSYALEMLNQLAL